MRRLLASLALTSALVWAGSASGAAAAPRVLPKLTVLVVAGQSNALGYQSFVVDPKTHKDVFTDSTRSPADHHVLLWWDESGVASASELPAPLDTAQKLSGAPSPVFGPEVGLARYLYAHGHHNLLVVKVAFSGSSLAVDWAKTAPDYKALVTTVTDALAWARTSGWRPVIGGVYWMQGETDAMSATMASAYGANLKAFLSNVRSSLSLSATTPFVLGQIDLADVIEDYQAHHLCPTPTCSAERLWNEQVMGAQSRAAGPYVYVTKTAKLPRYDDFLHLTNTAELALGKAFGQLSASHLA